MSSQDQITVECPMLEIDNFKKFLTKYSGCHLEVVDREWALCMHHQISLPPTIWVIDNLCTPGLAACCLLKKITWPILPQATPRNPRRTITLGTSMLCLWGCGSRGCISLVSWRLNFEGLGVQMKLSYKYFVHLGLIPKSFSKVSKVE